jgi:hypothetical protein
MNDRLLLGAMYGETGDWKTGLVYTTDAERLVDEILAKPHTDLVSEDNKVTSFINQAIALRHLGRFDEAPATAAAADWSWCLKSWRRIKTSNAPVSYLADLQEQKRESWGTLRS